MAKLFEEIIETECLRQIDKSNTNHIGYFHQNLFRLVGNGWVVPKSGFDIVNAKRHIYVEMKNKHNTMNSSSAQKTYMRMQNQLLKNKKSKCMLVEVVATKSQDVPWVCSLDGKNISHEQIRRVSLDKFYEIVFHDNLAFVKLCKALPQILDDVLKETHRGKIKNSVYKEMKKISQDTFKSLFLLAFRSYEGFDNF